MHTVFLVEDDEYLGRVYERAFRFAGFTLELVTDGEAALQKLSTMDPLPAVVIMDFRLPKMDGFELLQNLRKDTRYDAVPMVILTNSIMENEAQRFLNAGADLYMVKIEEQSKDVVDKVAALINKGRAGAAHS